MLLLVNWAVSLNGESALKFRGWEPSYLVDYLNLGNMRFTMVKMRLNVFYPKASVVRSGVGVIAFGGLVKRFPTIEADHIWKSIHKDASSLRIHSCANTISCSRNAVKRVLIAVDRMPTARQIDIGLQEHDNIENYENRRKSYRLECKACTFCR